MQESIAYIRPECWTYHPHSTKITHKIKNLYRLDNIFFTRLESTSNLLTCIRVFIFHTLLKVKYTVRIIGMYVCICRNVISPEVCYLFQCDNSGGCWITKKYNKKNIQHQSSYIWLHTRSDMPTYCKGHVFWHWPWLLTCWFNTQRAYLISKYKVRVTW